MDQSFFWIRIVSFAAVAVIILLVHFLLSYVVFSQANVEGKLYAETSLAMHERTEQVFGFLPAYSTALRLSHPDYCPLFAAAAICVDVYHSCQVTDSEVNVSLGADPCQFRFDPAPLSDIARLLHGSTATRKCVSSSSPAGLALGLPTDLSTAHRFDAFRHDGMGVLISTTQLQLIKIGGAPSRVYATLAIFNFAAPAPTSLLCDVVNQTYTVPPLRSLPLALSGDPITYTIYSVGAAIAIIIAAVWSWYERKEVPNEASESPKSNVGKTFRPMERVRSQDQESMSARSAVEGRGGAEMITGRSEIITTGRKGIRTARTGRLNRPLTVDTLEGSDRGGISANPTQQGDDTYGIGFYTGLNSTRLHSSQRALSQGGASEGPMDMPDRSTIADGDEIQFTCAVVAAKRCTLVGVQLSAQALEAADSQAMDGQVRPAASFLRELAAALSQVTAIVAAPPPKNDPPTKSGRSSGRRSGRMSGRMSGRAAKAVGQQTAAAHAQIVSVSGGAHLCVAFTRENHAVAAARFSARIRNLAKNVAVQTKSGRVRRGGSGKDGKGSVVASLCSVAMVTGTGTFTTSVDAQMLDILGNSAGYASCTGPLPTRLQRLLVRAEANASVLCQHAKNRGGVVTPIMADDATARQAAERGRGPSDPLFIPVDGVSWGDAPNAMQKPPPPAAVELIYEVADQLPGASSHIGKTVAQHFANVLLALRDQGGSTVLSPHSPSSASLASAIEGELIQIGDLLDALPPTATESITGRSIARHLERLSSLIVSGCKEPITATCRFVGWESFPSDSLSKQPKPVDTLLKDRDASIFGDSFLKYSSPSEDCIKRADDLPSANQSKRVEETSTNASASQSPEKESLVAQGRRKRRKSSLSFVLHESTNISPPVTVQPLKEAEISADADALLIDVQAALEGRRRRREEEAAAATAALDAAEAAREEDDAPFSMFAFVLPVQKEETKKGDSEQPMEFVDRRQQLWRRSSVVLGTGTYGTVYLGMGCDGTHVAIKIIPILSESENECVSVVREVSLLARVKCDRVVQYISGAVVNGDFLCIVMEAVGGSSLHAAIQQYPVPLPRSLIVQYLRDILLALAHLHSHGVAHRDLKPQNVLITESGRLKLADFGQATFLGTAAAKEKSGDIAGTIVYMSPEACNGILHLRTDIWSFGILAVQLATGELPYHPADVALPHGILHRLGNQDSGYLPILDETIPSWLLPLVQRCLKWVASERPSAEELLQDPLFSRGSKLS